MRVLRGRSTSYSLLPLRVLAPAHWARLPGSASGTRFAGSSSLWPDSFPPSPPPPLLWLCSKTSQVPTSLSDFPCSFIIGFVLRLPDTARLSRANMGSPGSQRDVSIRAQGLRPRGSPSHLATTMRRILPSALAPRRRRPGGGTFSRLIAWPILPLSTLR